MSSITQELGAYVSALQYSQIPSSAADMAKKCVLDAAANIIYGRYTETGERALAYATAFERGGTGSCDTFRSGSWPLETAAFLHAVMSRCADLDDGNRFAMGHPGCVLVPVTLAAAQEYRRSGEELLCALTAGYDVYVRLGRSINPTSYRDRGFDATGLCGAVAAAAVTAKLMGLDAAQTADAIGLASLFCGGLIEYQNDGTMGKTLCGAWAASTGIRAARLAQQGFTGPVKAIEGKKAFAQAFSNAPDTSRVLEKLNKEYAIESGYLKLHACMRGLHSAIDAAVALKKAHSLEPWAIKAVTVHTTPFVQRLSNPAPTTPVGAQCSLEFSMATAFCNGHLSDEHLLVKSLDDPTVLALAQRISIVLDPELERFVQAHPDNWSAVRVEVVTASGETFSETVLLPCGEPENPLSWNDAEAKFDRMTESALSAEAGRALKEKIRSLHTESAAQIGTFWQLS